MAFVIDVFVRRIVGRRVSSSMRTNFVLDALKQALYARQPKPDNSFGLLLHGTVMSSKRGVIRAIPQGWCGLVKSVARRNVPE